MSSKIIGLKKSTAKIVIKRAFVIFLVALFGTVQIRGLRSHVDKGSDTEVLRAVFFGEEEAADQRSNILEVFSKRLSKESLMALMGHVKSQSTSISAEIMKKDYRKVRSRLRLLGARSGILEGATNNNSDHDDEGYGHGCRQGFRAYYVKSHYSA